MDAQAIAISVGAIASGASAIVAAVEYRTKRHAERAESDIKLATIFAELVRVANGYGRPAELPDALVSAVFEAGLVSRDDLATGKASRLISGAMPRQPTGLAMQCAAMRSIAELGIRHEVLLQPARSAIQALNYFTEDSGVGKDAWEAASVALRDTPG